MESEKLLEVALSESEVRELRRSVVLDARQEKLLRQAKRTDEGVLVSATIEDVTFLEEAIGAKYDKTLAVVKTLGRIGDRLHTARLLRLLSERREEVERLLAEMDQQTEQFPDPVTPGHVNRAVLVAKPKTPFLDWVRGLPKADPEEDFEITLDSLRQDATAFLIPEYGREQDIRAWIDRHYDLFFEELLRGWNENGDCFPPDRTAEMFHEWFDLEIHSLIYDVADDELFREEWPEEDDDGEDER